VYWQAADAQFKNEHEIAENCRKMRELRYKGHSSDYLVKLQDLNRQVGSAGQVFRDQVKSQMLSEIVDIIYTMGPLPMEDDEFLRVLELAGKRVEEKKRDAKISDTKINKQHSEENKKEHKKDKKDKKENKDKKEKNYKNNENNKISKKENKKKRDFKFANVKEALQGISEELITKHKEAKANYWRCGREGHNTLECYAKKMEDGEEIIKAAVSATKKTSRKKKICAQCIGHHWKDQATWTEPGHPSATLLILDLLGVAASVV
jgi:hypothetical protein